MPRRGRDRASAPRRPAPPGRMRAVLVVVTAAVLGTAGTASAAPKEPDTQYLAAAHQSDLAIIAAGQDAQTSSRSSCVGRVGVLLERDHSMLAARARRVAKQLGVKLPTGPSPAQRRALDAIKTKAGTSGYDAAWLATQRQEHQRALALIDAELADGTQPAVKSLAAGARPVIQMHRDMVGGTCRTRTGSPSVATGDGGQAADARRLRRLAGLGLVGAGVLLLTGYGATRLRRRIAVRQG